MDVYKPAVVVQNPLANATSTPATLPGQTRPFEKLFMLPAPLCCVSKGGQVTTVAPNELLVREDVAYCKTSVNAGAGYNVTRIEMNHVGMYELFQERFLCFAAKNVISATALPSGHKVFAQIGPTDDAEFTTAMASYAPVARGRPAPAPGALPLGAFARSQRCGLNTQTMRMEASGIISLDDIQRGPTTLRHYSVAFMEDLNYVRYTSANLCATLCGDGTNKIEVSFAGDKYYMDLPVPLDQLPTAHKAVLVAALGREPSAPIAAFTGAIGELAIGPEFTTVSVNKAACMGLCGTSEVITIKTSDVSHLYSALPSWQNALIAAIRDIELFKLSTQCSNLWTTDLALLPVWPCSFFSNAYVSMLMLIKAMLSIFTFVMIFCFRKTSLILGGPGPAKQTAFLPVEDPATFLRAVADPIARAQTMWSWAKPTGGGQPALPSPVFHPAPTAPMSAGEPKHHGHLSDPLAVAGVPHDKLDSLERHVLRIETALLKALASGNSGALSSGSGDSDPHSVRIEMTSGAPKGVPPVHKPAASTLSAQDARETKEAAAQAKAKKALAGGALPPGWDYESAGDGETYYIQRDGETTWDDPRENWDLYWREFM